MLHPISHYLREHQLEHLLAEHSMKRGLWEILGESAPPLAESIVISGDRIRFTPIGRRYYSRRFARVGINIGRVRTLERFKDASALSFAHTLEEAALWMNRHRPRSDEYRLLIAIIQGDSASRQRLERRLARKARLTVVEGVQQPTSDSSRNNRRTELRA